MIKKSIPATIVTSLIVLFLRQVIIMNNPTNQESVLQVILVLVFTLVAVIIAFQKKVTKLE
jgi:uncharacterized membrane protein YqhA